MSEARIVSEDDFNRHNQSYGPFNSTPSASPNVYAQMLGESVVQTMRPGDKVTGTITRNEDGSFTFVPYQIGKPDDRIVCPEDSLLAQMGYDWKKEQRAIAEEARHESELQTKIQKEMNDARVEQERYAYKVGKARCAANPMAFGVGLILPDGTWISHEEARSIVFPDGLVPGPDVKAARDLLDAGMKALLDSVGIPEFPGARMREYLFARKILPLPSTNDELDRSIPIKPTPAMYPNNPEQYLRHCRLFNNMVAGTSEPPIPAEHIESLASAYMAAQLSEQALLAAKHQEPAFLAAARERAERNTAIWKQFMDPALGVSHVERVDQDADCGAVVVKESTDAPGPDPT